MKTMVEDVEGHDDRGCKIPWSINDRSMIDDSSSND